MFDTTPQKYSIAVQTESLGIDSEAYLFSILKGYKKEFPNLISRSQYNDRRKFTRNLCETIRKRMADSIDGGEDYFCIDSKPIEVCRVARGKLCTMGKNDYRILCITQRYNRTIYPNYRENQCFYNLTICKQIKQQTHW